MSDHNKPGFIFKGDANFATMSMPPSGLTRIATALERIATALEKANRLKALEFGKNHFDGTPVEVREIMEG